MNPAIIFLAVSAVFLTCYVISEASASHKTTLPCSVTVQGKSYPVHYEGQVRNNPDGTYYPNDAFFYIMRYSASPTCIDIIIHPLVSHGLSTGSTGTKYIDADSAGKFQNTVNNLCNTSKKYSGCVHGIATINQLSSCTDTESGCIGTTNLVQKVTGLKRVCKSDGDGGTTCTIVRITRTATISPRILMPDLDLILTKETVRDPDSYDARNLDGTYYVWDPVVIRHVPELEWKNDRTNTIHFDTVMVPDLVTEYETVCGDDSCIKHMTHPKVSHKTWHLGHGDGITMYAAPDHAYLGLNHLRYHTTVTNAGLTLDHISNNTDALVVRYDPKYSEYPYPLLSDLRRTSYENRAAVALHYFGSYGGGPDDVELLHEDRRSKINHFDGTGAGFDPWNPVLFDVTPVWSEAHNVGILDEHGMIQSEQVRHSQHPNIIPCETGPADVMMVKAGYCKVYFEYDILDTIYGSTGPRYENATLFNTLISEHFAGYDTKYISHYEYRFAESLFHTELRVTSVGPDGIINPIPLSVSIMPAADQNVQPMPAYIHEKVTYDSKDPGFGRIISNDTYPINYSESDTGEITIPIYRISSKFETYLNGDTSLEGLDIVSLAPLYIESSYDARLDVPLYVGFGALSPITIQVSAGNDTRQYGYDYVDFDRDIEIPINLSQDNTLEISRNPGSISVITPKEFGIITKLYVDGIPINTTCHTRCTINVGDDQTSITAENDWGGMAHVTVPEFIPEQTPAVPSSGFEVLAVFVLVLPAIYWVYTHVKNR